jgi:hypothetical protein
MSARTTPASTVRVSLKVSIARMRFKREVETITSLMSACGWLAPVSPVLPACGTIGVRVSAQIVTISATSAVEAGRSTSGTRPCQSSRQLRQ